MTQHLLAALLALLGAEEPFRPPASNQPNFRGAIGRFRLQTAATPVTVPVRQPIRFVVTIIADENVPVHSPPTRLELEKNAEFRDLFDIETPEPAQKQQGRKWEFFYLLRPRSEKVKEIPEVSFCFFNPTFAQDPRGYQQPSTEPIAITVEPAQLIAPPIPGVRPLDSYPDSVLQLPEESLLLRREQPWTPPAAGWFVVLLVVPPVASLTWLFVWRRLYPDAAGQAKRRRSRAARTALSALTHARSTDRIQRAEQISAAVTGYLRERLDLASSTPTPAEVDTFLRGLGVADSLRESALALFETCDALRFSAMPPAVSESLADEAEALILALEGQPWSSPRC